MKRKNLIVVVIAAVGWLIVPRLGGVFHEAASAQDTQTAQTGLPKFELDPAWPKIPAKWKLGYVSAASADDQDHIWVLHRPRTLPPDQRATAASPVLEFDNAGNFIQAWGAGQRI